MAGWFKSRQPSDDAELPQAVYQDQSMKTEDDAKLELMASLTEAIDRQAGKLPDALIRAARKEIAR